MALTPEDQAIIDKLNETGWTADPSEPPPLTDEDTPRLSVLRGGGGSQAEDKPKAWRSWTPSELRAHMGEPKPIRGPYLIDGCITELDGYLKDGKTTFVTALCRSVIDGTEFLGVQSVKSPVVYMNESPAISFMKALDNAGLSESEDLHILNFHEAFDVEWPDKVKKAVDVAKEFGAKLLVVDTFSQWAGIVGEDENSAGRMLDAIKPIQEHAQMAGLAILLIRHTRKSQGPVGVSGRGSTAISGVVDDIVLIERFADAPTHNQRLLTCTGRNSHPDRQVIELVDDEYRLVGTVKQAKVENIQAEIIRVLTDEPQTRKQIYTQLKEKGIKCRGEILVSSLQTLFSMNLLVRNGTGLGRQGFKYKKLAVPEAKNVGKRSNPIESTILAFPIPSPPKGGEGEVLGQHKTTREPGEDG